MAVVFFMKVIELEQELKKRWKFPYRWGVVQNDELDQATRFIYDILYFDELMQKLESLRQHPRFELLQHYALNRWYNFQSARTVEHFFCSQPQVVAAPNRKDRLCDFYIQDIPFDHKTSVFPRQYGKTLFDARRYKSDLIRWLYTSQSKEQRFHLKNRLFLVLYRNDGEHWKLKAKLTLLQNRIKEYMLNFSPEQLIRIPLESEQPTLSDIIWVIR